MNKLSVVLATHNEEENIKDCLNSVKDLADEIVVVDGSSSDQTRSIAKQLGAKVFKVKNQLMFHVNKQRALDLAKNEWILQLDADERTTEDLKKEIISVIHQPSTINGFYIPRKNYFLSRFLTKGGQYPNYVIRLVRKGKAWFPCKSVHEQIKVEGNIGYLKSPLIHWAYRSLTSYIKRANRYTDLNAEELLEKKVSFSLFTQLKYLIWLPITTFFKIFIRHKGFIDGFAGFVFALFSGLHYPITYIKYWELKRAKR